MLIATLTVRDGDRVWKIEADETGWRCDDWPGIVGTLTDVCPLYPQRAHDPGSAGMILKAERILGRLFTVSVEWADAEPTDNAERVY